MIGEPREARRAAWWRFTVGNLVNALAIVMAFINAPLALAIIGLVAVYYSSSEPPANQPTGPANVDRVTQF